uniref:Uncharacterized protein n=1 Tax=Oryza sativa subsp. japonica TaxID=39947 RepID=Q2R436_ORYSJ|nr:hypothetical protein LOC_Os11g29830 [Oryza sativa Japonica Group]
MGGSASLATSGSSVVGVGSDDDDDEWRQTAVTTSSSTADWRWGGIADHPQKKIAYGCAAYLE